jgi:hypothetical protein
VEAELKIVKLFSNITVGTKLLTCYLIILALAVAVGGLAIFRVNQLNSIVGDLSGNLAANQHLSDELESHAVLSQFYALQYINQKDPADLDRYRDEMTDFRNRLTASQEKITKAKQAEMLSQIEARVEVFEEKFGEATVLMTEQQQVRDKVLEAQATLAGARLDQLYNDAFRDDDTAALYHIGTARREFSDMRLEALQYLNEGGTPLTENLNNRYHKLLGTFDRMSEELDDSSQLKLAARAEANTAVFFESIQSLELGRDRQAALIDTLNSLSSQMQTAASGLSSSTEADIAAKAEYSDGIVSQAQIVILGIILAVVGVGVGFGVVIDQAVRKRLDQGPPAGTDLAPSLHDVRMDVSSKDGVRVLAEAICQMTSNTRERLEADSDLRKN